MESNRKLVIDAAQSKRAELVPRSKAEVASGAVVMAGMCSFGYQ